MIGTSTHTYVCKTTVKYLKYILQIKEGKEQSLKLAFHLHDSHRNSL